MALIKSSHKGLEEWRSGPPDKEGTLTKWTNYVNGWQLRWFRLDGVILSYYVSKAASRRPNTCRHSITIHNAEFELDPSDDCQFTVVTDDCTFYLHAISSAERADWLQAMKIAQYNAGRPTMPLAVTGPGVREANQKKIEKQLAEIAKAKAVLLIDVRVLEEEVKKVAGDNNAVLESCSHVIESANRMSTTTSECGELMTNLLQREKKHQQGKNQDKRKPSIGSPRPIKVQENVDEFQSSISINKPSQASQSDDDYIDAVGLDAASHLAVDSSNWAAAESDGSDIEGGEGEKYLILSLLSQLKIGMDLTKITLPTFVLERRSLLEMYADFMAHPDLFSRIPEGATPLDRMMQVVRWYLTAFHEGRKSNAAKKPYNPIMGETFRCRWKLENEGLGAVSYIAEQVSHHPPVSAFYVENPATQVSLNAHIWTKSKFLGTSLSVAMVGEGRLVDIAHNEEYVITFPSAYARSILTVPWVELGGSTCVACAATGYTATVEFLSKPMFGGETNRIQCLVRNNQSEEPIAKITGKWNGQLMIAAPPSAEPKLFADTTNLHVMKKACAPLAEQGLMESRRLWNDVTMALKDRDIDRATYYKSCLEEKQRQSAKLRQQTGEKYQPKLFHWLPPDNWVYDHRLSGGD